LACLHRSVVEEYQRIKVSPKEIVSTIERPPILRLLCWQLGALLLVALSLMMVGRLQSISFLAGGLIQIAPNWWFARQVFRYMGASSIQRVITGFYVGETGKFLLSGLLFALLFVLLPPVDIIALFAGYVSMLLVHTVTIEKLLRQ